MKSRSPITSLDLQRLSPLRWLLLIPALAASLTAQSAPPAANMERTVAAISRPASTDAAFLEPAQGTRFTADFDDGTVGGLTQFCLDPAFASHVSTEFTDGAIRIRGTCEDCERWVGYRVATNQAMPDFVMSIDILAWDKGPSTRPNSLSMGLAARGVPGPTGQSIEQIYLGGATLSYPPDPVRSAIWVWKTTGSGPGNYVGQPNVFSPVMDPARNYRLVFRGVGSELTVQLIDLLTPETVYQSLTVHDTSLTQAGEGGFYVQSKPGFGPTIDITLDNFVAVGTTPE